MNLPNHPDAKRVKIILDKERHVYFSAYSLLKFKEETGHDLINMDGTSPTDMIPVLWAGLITEDKTLTVEQVAEMIPLSQLEHVMNKVTGAIQIATPPSDKESRKTGPLVKTKKRRKSPTSGNNSGQ